MPTVVTNFQRRTWPLFGFVNVKTRKDSRLGVPWDWFRLVRVLLQELRERLEAREQDMTLTLTPSLTIGFRRAANKATRLFRTHTRRLSIWSLSLVWLEVLVFKYHSK